MPRKRRVDTPGLFHHVMNRGVAGRPIFERPDDYRYFKLLLACAVRASKIRVHGFSLMSNHYHLLAESLDGRIGEAMRRIQALYASRFNRTRDTRRPGHLFGARFKSFPIRGDAYLFAAAGYIDHNPVKAGLCQTAWQYPHGSAQVLLLRDRTPLWVCPATMDRLLAPLLSTSANPVEAYTRLHANSADLDAMDIVVACIEGRAPVTGMDVDDLLGGNHAHRRTWLERQANRSDDTRVSMPVVHPRSVQRVVAELRRREPALLLTSRSSLSLWSVVETGLLRDLAGIDFGSIGALSGVSQSAAAKRHERHRRCMREDASYANVAALITGEALERCYGARATTIARRVVRRRLSPKVVEST